MKSFLLLVLLSLTAEAQVQGPVPETYFGMAIHLHGNPGAGGLLPTMPWPDQPFGLQRLIDDHVYWCQIETARGVYDWSVLDSWLDQAAAQGITQVGYTFYGTPLWATSVPNNGACPYGNATDGGYTFATFPPTDNAMFTEFVAAIVQHSVGRDAGHITMYEMWNEPSQINYWGGTVQQLEQMVALAYLTIHANDPNAIVTTPSPVGNDGQIPTWFNAYFDAGGGNYADAVGFHGYVRDGFSTDSLSNGLIPMVAAIKTSMATYGVPATMPIYNWEWSWGTQSLYPDLDQQVGFVGRGHLLFWSLGVSHAAWYQWGNGDYPPDTNGWGTLWVADGGGDTPAGRAYGQVEKWMVGATMILPCREDAQSTFRCQFERAGGYKATAIWNSAQSVVEKLPYCCQKLADYRDLDGGMTLIDNTFDGGLLINYKPILLENSQAW